LLLALNLSKGLTKQFWQDYNTSNKKETEMTENLQNVMAWMPGGWEWIVILIVALLLFGKRLPDVARSIGKSLTEFKKGLSEGQNAIDDATKEIKKTKDDIVDQTKDKDAANTNGSNRES
jgi:sec-independent protein translocase protein TatA